MKQTLHAVTATGHGLAREQTKRPADDRYERMFRDHSTIGLLIDPTDGAIIDANLEAEKFYGYSREALQRMHISDINMLPADVVRQKIKEAQCVSRKYFLFPHKTASGEIKYVDVYSGPVEIDGTTLLYSVIHDVTDRQHIETALLRSEALLRNLMDNAAEAIFILNEGGQFVDVNTAACVSTGYSRDELLDLGLVDIDKKYDVTAARAVFEQVYDSGHVVLESIHQRKDGSRFPVEVGVSSARVGDERLFYGVARDITKRKKERERIEHLATHDPLTGLPNRVLFHDRLLVALETARRNGTSVAILYLDLDGFKDINDRFGHSAGDQVLRHTGTRLRTCVRAADTIARIGGDEFAILLSGFRNDAAAATAVAKKVHAELTTPFDFDRGKATISASIGISLYPQDAERPDSLIHLADQAMYHVKKNGKDGAYFAADLDSTESPRR